MGLLTHMLPKPMLSVFGKTLLEHKFDALPEEVHEIVLVVGYLKERIIERFGDSYNGKKLIYVVQENPTGGTAQALWLARPHLRDRFLVMNGDNIYASADISTCTHTTNWAVLVQEKDRIRTGRVVVDQKDRITDIAENDDHGGEKGFANTGLYVLDMRIFDVVPVPKAVGSSELGLPQTMLKLAHAIPIHIVRATMWIEIKAPEDLARAETLLSTLATK